MSALIRSLSVIPLLLLSVACMLQTDEEAFSIDGAVHRVVVETDAGDIRLIEGVSGEVQVEASLAWAGERPELAVDYRGGVLHLKSPCLAEGATCEVSYTLTLPRGVVGELRSATGDIWMDGPFEPISAISQRGSVTHHKAAQPRD